MRRKDKDIFVGISELILWSFVFHTFVCDGAVVDEVQPRYGSLAGETRLTVYGNGFSKDQYSQNDDPNTGNKVYLVGLSGSEHVCVVHKDGCTETQVQCYTPRGMSEEDHYVKLVVDGDAVPDDKLCGGEPTSPKCTYKPQMSNTPSIDTFTPQSGKPGDLVTMYGKLISDRYGSNMASATNGKTEKITRVYVGPQDCGLKNGDEFYGLALNSEESDYGTLTCKTKGTSVGYYNASFIIESPYGRSKPNKELYRVSSNDQVYMFQAYTDITSLSQSTGSVAGGLALTIYGNYFDDRAPYVQPKAFIGDAVCDILAVEIDQYITCKVPENPNFSGSKFEGNRGVNFEYWTATSKTANSLDSILSLTSSDPGYNAEVLDETYHLDTNNTMDTYVSRMTTFFTPPHTGEYQFFLNADDGARLYVDGVAAVTSSKAWAASSRRTLNENTKYLLEVVHFENTGNSFVHLKAKYYDTKFTSAWTGNAVQEEQVLQIRSTVKYDVQSLQFKQFTSQTSVSEVQTVEVNTAGKFRFGLYGVYTEPLSTDMSEAAIQDALNALPVFGTEESIIVARNPTSIPTYKLTFDSHRGDFPNIEVIKVGNSSDVTYTVTENTRGSPDLDTVALSLEGVVSDPFSVSSLSASSLENAINSMFEAKCPSVFEGPGISKYYQSFETDSTEFIGTRTKDTEPFCGRYVLENPFRIYRKKDKELGILMSQYGTLCFAYKGFLQNFIRATVTYKDTDQVVQTRVVYHLHSFKTDSETTSENWYYTCANLYDTVYARFPTGTEHRLDEVRVHSLNADQQGYVDSVFIGRKETTIDPEVSLRRLPPSRPNGALINEISVIAKSTTLYEVTLKPFDCGNEFPLFELANGRVTGGRLGYPSTSATSTLNNGAGAITVTRLSNASPPVTGLIDVTFNGKTRTGLNITLDPKDFDRELEALNGIGALSVEKEGDCANFDLIVTFLTLPGDLPEMTMTYNQLMGIDAVGSIATNVDGGLFYTPLTGDMVSTVHSSPQVRLFINDVPTACTGDCSFQWDASLTPTVTVVTPITGTSALGTTITISGTKFSPDITKNTVTIGGVECIVTASTASSITCDVGNGAVGEHVVVVNVDGKGDAQHPGGDVTFAYTAAITGISPTTGSLGGGLTLTISGYGFKAGAAVTINSEPCTVTSVNPGQIECTVPPMSADGTHDVVIVQGSVTLSHSGYSYDSSLTATVSSVTPSSLGVQGGRLTIVGSSFSSNTGNVFVGSTPASVSSWTDNQIIVDVGTVPAGVHDLRVETANGRATDGNGNIPTITVELSISNVFPLRGSLLGGTRLTISGAGFGTNSSVVDISVGDAGCDILVVSNSQIICEIENAAKTHEVTNKGSDPDYGVYYAFDKPFLTISQGDFVRWTWETPSFVNDVAHAIIEVESPSSTNQKIGGFSSGAPRKNGQYQYQFTQTGTFYVWSGYVDQWNIKQYAGTINVVKASSYAAEISVRVAGVEALHNVGGAPNPVDGSSCKAVTDAKSLCSDSLPTGNASKFNFAFWSCSTPIINVLAVNNGTVQTTVTISGEGLSTKDCQNEIKFGLYDCDVSSSSDSKVTCNFAKSGEPELGLLHQLTVRVGNRGNAIVALPAANRGFGVLPNIESITPTSGSTAGGARVTITGFGFGDSPLVNIGNYPCTIIESSYTEIICVNPPYSTGERNIEVQAYVGGSPLTAACELLSKTQCTFSYAPLWTPKMATVSPDSMSSVTTFNISGELFGTNPGELEVTIGGIAATVTTASNTYLLARIENIPAGNNDLVVRVKNYGKAAGNLIVYGTPLISSVNPSSGSINGGTTITIQGNGFVVNDTTITVGGSACVISSTTLSEVTCVTAAHVAGSLSVDVTSNGVSYTSSSFNYDAGSTPTVTSISPTSGFAGDTLTVTGSNLNGGTVTVKLGDSECVFVSGNSGQIQCTVGNHVTGSVPVSVHVTGLGVSNDDVQFEYQLSLTAIVPSQGGTAGGQTVTLSGSGFDNTATVTICGNQCALINTTSSQLTCRTSSNTAQTCNVDISINGLTKTLNSAYTYNAALTPSVSSVSPARGGTGGGTTITISGSGFGSNVGNVNVQIDGVECVVSTTTNTEIQCLTGPHVGSADAKVEVQVSGNGIAEEATSGAAAFSYIDVWSSTFTWGGGPLPQEGEFIIILKGMTLLLDIDTPVLSFLLIQGGKLIFDNKDVELQSKIIMITDGGLLQVGTESEPFQHKGIITLHGHHRDKELPIYGTKVLAVRNGTLDLHGIEVPITWTRLATTASAGATTIRLSDPVEWNVGDEIVIASSGHKHSQSENEKKTITSISVDKRTLTLDSALEAKHWGTSEIFDGTLVEFRAEVGLLTHNVVVRGNQEPEWQDKIEACEEGFDTGEFVTQTCFQGRFGDEVGSSQFGAMILVHAPVMNTHEAQARISYTEVTSAGQAFRLGRYPIHFHLNGDMSTSYVRGCGIHKTFNRAVNIHGTHNTMVEKTVIYDIMGGAFFLEDGIETGNTFQYNLAVFVRESTSLLNDDITPASFWVTNPNNTIQHNAAAGGSHFGFWYRMHDHPDGPSYTETVCPKNVPLGVFQNNSAHSFGWFGLWIFEDYFPMKGACGGTEVEPAVFRSLFAWNCDKGAEAVNSGALQFVDFILVQNKLAGYEGKLVLYVPQYTDESPMIKDSLIVGKTSVIPDTVEQGCTKGGLIFPYGNGFRVINVRFVNFNHDSCATFRFTRIDGTCGLYCGGFTYHTEGLKFVNSPNKGVYAWDWEGIILDKDGSATGKSSGNWTILPTTGSLPSDCEPAPEFGKGASASFCPPQYKWHRFSFNKVAPASLEGKNFLITNQYGTSSVPFADKRISHKLGWMCALLDGATYKFEFEFADQIKNISFDGQFYSFETDDYLLLKLEVEEAPDRFSFDGGKTFINATVGGIDPATASNGDWEWDNANNIIKFAVHGRKRSKRGFMSTYSVDRPLKFTSYKCYFKDCIPPPDPNTIPPATERPLDFEYWDDTTRWNNSYNDTYVTNSGGIYGIPQDYDNVRIAADTWVVVNRSMTFNKLGTLLLEGVLEFFDTPGAVYEIEADFIIIRGGRLIIGWPNDPFDGLATITLRGDHSSTYFFPGDGPTLGSKAIGVFGGLDLFGKDVGRTWTQLAVTANKLSNTIVLADPVEWSAGDDIVLGPTGFDPWQTESFKILSVAADNVTLTLNASLKFTHKAHNEVLTNGQEISVGAAVGLLTHNIKIIGQDYADLYEESFGARVLIGLITSEGQTYTGYARLSNVEFYHTGQEGFTEEYDPRFSVAYVAAGTVSNVKPSFISKCSFHNGFSTAIGVFGTNSLNVTDNVVFGSVGNGLRTTSDDTRLVNNLVALMIATDGYQNRFERFKPHWETGIEAMGATELVLKDNLVTGSERYAYHIPPLDCDDDSGRYSNNRAYANVIGFVIMYEDVLPQTTCAKFTSQIVWKTHDFGFYYQNIPSIVAENNVYIDNQNGMFTIVLHPDPVEHLYADKTVAVRDTTFVGQTDGYDCINDVTPTYDDNFKLSEMSRPSLPKEFNGMIGLVFPNFYKNNNEAPLKGWINTMSYNAIGGLMTLNNVTFAKYTNTGCKKNFAISTNYGNDDLQHPILVKDVTLIDVDHSNKVYYHRPNENVIDSSNCVDMDCDAKKKALVKDLDGSFLGHVGAVIPQSEFEWDENPVRGLGDYRIPKELVTDSDGNRIPYDSIAPNKGVIRNNNCTYQPSWQAYECFEDLNYELLVIESMDTDTETRRLSPVAVLGDGYIDLINGPQDHGWCSGYTCRKRLSTFMALVATDKEYLLHFTSLTPEHLRYRLLNVDGNKGIKLSVWYSRANRLDVFVDDDFVMASNAEMSNGRYVTSIPKGNEFEPQIANGTGTNFFKKESGYLTFIIAGPQRIDIVTQKTIIVSFGIPGLTVDDFFGENLVENMASFLNIPLTKVRVVNVVSAASKGRRKRSGTGITVELEIGDEPVANINATLSDSIDFSALLEYASDIVNECQVGNISESLNITGACETVEVPSSDPAVASIVYHTPSPDHLYFHTEPVSKYEGVLLKTQPKIRAADLSNSVVTELGTAEFPWQLTVSLRSGTGHPNAQLNGTLTVDCSDGWFNFTDLTISHMGSGYILDFNVTFPVKAENFTLASDPFDVEGRPLKIHVYDKTSGDIVKNARFSVTLDLQDPNTLDIISDIAWRDHTWTAEASMLGSSPYGSLGGVLTSSFDPTTGRALFPDLNMGGFGVFYVQFRVVSNPPDFNLTLNHKMTIKNPAHVGMTIEEEYEVKVKFNVDFNKILPTEDKENEFEQMILTEYANTWPNVQLSVGSIKEGSIVVTFVIAGSSSDVNTTAYSLCDTIQNQTTYSYNGYSLTLSPYMTINNQTYYGVTCGDMEEEDEKEGLAVYWIVIIVLLSALIVAAVAAVVVWRCSVKPKTQTRVPITVKPKHSTDWRTGILHNGEKSVEDYLFREDSADLANFIRSKPPITTTIGGGEKRPHSGFSLRISSPGPISVTDLLEDKKSTSSTFAQPPAYSERMRAIEPMHVATKGNERWPRTPSSSMYGGLESRAHSAVSDRESPLPPVGQSMYTSE